MAADNKKKLVDDVMTLGNAIVGNVLGARHELKAQAGEKLDALTQQLKLVTRAEFDAAFSMLGKARSFQEDLIARLEKLEKHLGVSSAKKSAKKTVKAVVKAKKKAKVNLPSVKKSGRKAKRK
jgi:BMFP domain-containing protein YqiC